MNQNTWALPAAQHATWGDLKLSAAETPLTVFDVMLPSCGDKVKLQLKLEKIQG